MQVTYVNGVLAFAFSPIGSLTLAVIMLLLGSFLRKKITFFERYCLPSPVIGGVIFATLNLIFHQTGLVNITLNNSYQNDFQFMFFTIVGFSASLAMLKAGGPKLIRYFLLTGILIMLQGIVGVFVAGLVNVPRVLGIVCGPASLCGGHGSVGAYGQMLEEMGYSGTMVTGMAAATFGLITGGLFGGPLCDRLIRKNNLTNPNKGANLSAGKMTYPKSETTIVNTVSAQTILVHIAIICSFMTLGNYLGVTVGSAFNISLPGFVGPMFIAFIVRNLN